MINDLRLQIERGNSHVSSDVNQNVNPPTTDVMSNNQTPPGADSIRGEHDFQAAVTAAWWRQRLETPVDSPLQDPAKDPDTKPLTFDSDGSSYGNAEPTSDLKNATPQEAAAWVNHYGNVSMQPDRDAARANQFSRALQEHQNDPQWIQDFFKALGADESARLISKAFSPETYHQGGISGWPQQDITQRTDAVRNAILTLYHSGKLNQADINKLVDKWASNGNFNPRISAELFGKMTYEDQSLKNMFFTSAANKSMALSGSAASDWAAAATTVLSQTSGDNQVEQLNGIRTQYGSAAFRNFIARAASSDGNVNATDAGAQEFEPFSNNGPVPQDHFGNVGALWINAYYNDTRDAFNRAMPLSTSELNALRSDMFIGIQQSDKNLGSDTQKLLDQYFTEHTSDILNSLPHDGDGFLTSEGLELLDRYFPQVSGTSASDAMGVTEQLRKLPPGARADFIHSMMNNEDGKANLRVWTAGLSQSDKQLYADAINAAYQRNPEATLRQIYDVGDRYYGISTAEGAGFTEIIAATHNDDLIAAYAEHKLTLARQYPDGAPAASGASWDAAVALKGMSPQKLDQFVQAHSHDGLVEMLLKGVGKFQASDLRESPFGELPKQVGALWVKSLAADGLTADEFQQVRSVFLSSPQTINAESLSKLISGAIQSGSELGSSEMRDLGDIAAAYFKSVDVSDPQNARRALEDLIGGLSANLPPNLGPRETGYVTGIIAAGMMKNIASVAGDKAKQTAWLSTLVAAGGSAGSAAVGLAAGTTPVGAAVAVGLAVLYPVAQQIVNNNSNLPTDQVVREWIGAVKTDWLNHPQRYGWNSAEVNTASNALGAALNNNGFAS